MSARDRPTGLHDLVVEMLADLLGGPVAVRSLALHGFRNAWAGVVAVGDGARTVFVKARSGQTVPALTHERVVLENLPDGIGPSVLASCQAPTDGVAVLVVQDLSTNHWPPPWRRADVALTVELLKKVAAIAGMAGGMPRLVDVASTLTSWPAVAADRAAFLGTGLRSERWLDWVLPKVLELTAVDCLDGEALVHFDVRSDNISLGSAGAVLVDWEFACLGNPRVDLLSWLPSLRAEGGPAPWAVVPDAEPELVAFLAGYWSSQAGLPAPSGAPGLRSLQRAQASVALDWLDVCIGQVPGGG